MRARYSIPSRQDSPGFTIIELLAAISLAGVLLAIGFPVFSEVQGQLYASHDSRRVSSALSELRAEAIRLRSLVRVSFSGQGLSWDIYDDGVEDGAIDLQGNSRWAGASPPSDLVFNGLGLAESVNILQTLTIENHSYSLSITINGNGYIAL